MNKNALQERVICETQLVWSRYSAMMVAHAILIGFVGHLASSSEGNPSIGIIACFFGLLLALIWWLITSLGWSLAHSWWKAIQGLSSTHSADVDLTDIIYQQWIERIWKLKSQDPIWWSAHFVIILFYVGYLLLGVKFAMEDGFRWYYIAIGLIIAIGFIIASIWISFTKLQINKTPIAENK